MQIKKLAVAAGAAGALALSLVTAAPASADYAPSSGDLVGVGSDTLQYAGDFLADGDHVSDAGYNSGGFVNKWVNFDATADANARLAYGSGGQVGLGLASANTAGSSVFCAPGTGTAAGTGNANANSNGNTTCQLNPTIVLRAGLNPVQRPNGSGAGVNAMVKDIAAGAAGGNIDYARSSSNKLSSFATGTANTVTIGTEGVYMLASTTTNAVALSAQQLSKVYGANSTGTNGFGTTGCPTWGDVGVTGANATQTILPLLPQFGSGTRSYFIGIMNPALTESTLGNCTRTVEENDPEAIDASSSPANAIEPISGARLNMFLGLNGTGNNNVTGTGTTAGAKYFLDPSCVYGDNTVKTTQGGNTGLGTASVSCGTAQTASGTLAKAAALAPNVAPFKTAGNASDANPIWIGSRPLYIYVKTADISSSAQFQAGINQNKIRATLANPCSGTSQTGHVYVASDPLCSTVGGVTYGQGGQPYIATSAGQALISAAGINPSYTFA